MKLSVLAAVFFTVSIAAASEPTHITVYRSATCGCCMKWEKHLKDNGFAVDDHVESKGVEEIKDKFNIPKAVRSCHTAKVGGYFVEGHVPADSIKRLLKEHPKDVAGIAVPGMPVGSPGMEGDHVDKYDVVTFSTDGKTKVFEQR